MKKDIKTYNNIFKILIFCALGMANMWEAVFGDVGVTLIAIINSSRILKDKKI